MRSALRKVGAKRIDDLGLLKIALESGMIDLSTIQKQIDMQKRKELLNTHPYAVWEGKNGKWYTYLPDEEKGRVLKKRTTKEDIEDLVVKYYKENSEEEQKNKKTKTVTLKEIFPQWLEYKQIHTDSTSYVKRITADWKRFYSTEKELIEMPLSKMTKIYLDNWAHTMITKHELTKKQYYNMSIILRQCLDHAIELGYLSENVFSDVKINTKMFRRVKKKKGETQVYSPKEEECMIKDMIRRFNNNPKSTAPLAVIFAFETGVRIGELCALKIEDIDGDYINIQRQEVRDFEKIDGYTMRFKGYKIAEYAKSDDGYRSIYLTSTAKKIIALSLKMNEINKENNPQGFLFCKNNKNVGLRSVASMIEQGCVQNGIQVKTSHKIRKTYISSLIDEGINIDEIRRIAGHSDERTTYGNYCYNRYTDKQTAERLEFISSKKVIKGNQLLSCC